MTTKYYAITGIPRVPGVEHPPVRQEVNRWAATPANKKQLDLFLLALRDMQNTKIEDKLSYFRIAGIHSYPLQEWDGVPYQRLPNPNNKDGFCAHNLAIFPTWHRPYMILFEQHIHTLMLQKIKSWNLDPADAEPWLNAAHTFRLPYWDWARPQDYLGDYGLPEVCTWETVEVTLPSGKKESFDNPLSKFSNPTRVPMGDDSMGKYKIKDNLDKDKEPRKGFPPGLPWSKCIGTSRYGIYKDKDASTWNKGVNDWEKANSMIKKPHWYNKRDAGSFTDAVERMLRPGYHDSYRRFASTQYNSEFDPSNTSYLSLEFIHNVAHVTTGGFLAYSTKDQSEKAETGLGHMSDVPVSAFDPIFWLHHCNIDRLFAIWQALNEDKWFTPDIEPGLEYPLRPFHITESGELWNSNHTQIWTDYNYQYDELVRIPQDYDSDGTFNKDAYHKRLLELTQTLYKGTSDAVQAAPTFMSAEGEFPDFIVNILYDRLAIGGTAYSIMLFLGDPPEEDQLWQYNQHRNYLGQVYTFSSPVEIDGEVACGNCQSQQAEGVLSAGQIPVTIPLMQKAMDQQLWHVDGQEILPGGLPGLINGALNPIAVQEIFARRLRVVYVALGGDIRSAQEFPRTEIALLHAPAKLTAIRDNAGLDGVAGPTVVPEYNGQYKVLYKMFGGTEDSLSGPAAVSAGLIRDDPPST